MLALIVGLAALLRLAWLHKAPPAVNWDEAAQGYNAYSLWLTGKDEYGYKWPLSLRSFDDYKPPLYAYLTAPIVGIWGLNEFTTRLLAAVSGIVSVGLVYLITRKLIKDKAVAMIAAGMMAIEPWAIYFSRGAWESNLSLMLFLVVVWLILSNQYGWALALAGLNVFAYHSAKMYVWIIVGWIGVKLLKNREGWRGSLVGIIVAGVLFGVSITKGAGLARFGETSVLKVGGAAVGEVTQRYLAYFSPVNLFVRGSNEPNQRVDGFGLFYAWEIIFWLAGMVWLVKNIKENKFLASWVALGPLPAIITWSWFNPVRVLPLWAANAILIATGIRQIWKRLGGTTGKWVWGSVGGVWAGINLGWYFLALLFYVNYKNFGDWQWGFRETVAAIAPWVDKSDRVVWETGQAQPYIFVLFYTKYPPEKYQKERQANHDFGKYEFRKTFWPEDQHLPKTILVGGAYSLPIEKAITRVYDPQGYESARIVVTE